MRRRWVKLWTQETLFGTTTRELEPAERAVWFEFLALAGDSPIPGTICLAPGVAYQDVQLCQVLKVDLQILDSAIQKMVKAGKISRNGDNLISISNWGKYQASWDEAEYHREYMREWQKQDRAKKRMLIDVDSQHSKPSLPEGKKKKIINKNIKNNTKGTPPDPRVSEVAKGIEKLRGHPSPRPPAEAKAIKAMLAHYTPEDIEGCWQALDKDAFWHKQDTPLDKVAFRIGVWVKEGRDMDFFAKGDKLRGRVPEKYDPGDS